MQDDDIHRKRVLHYENPADVRELTFSCFQRRPLLCDDSRREMLARSIDRAGEGHGFRLTAFVFMPEHVHLVVYPVPRADPVDQYLYAIKRPLSFRIKTMLQSSDVPLLKELTVSQRPGRTVFRFWQEGPGHDRNLSNKIAVFNAIDYAHRNPLKRGLCAAANDWKWSSARFYATDGAVVDADLPKLHRLPSHFLT